jgi:hypothetical protein
MNAKNRKSFGNTNITGVCWVDSRKRYEAQFTDFNGKHIRKTFSISKFGNKERALQHARIWITAMQREYGYL